MTNTPIVKQCSACGETLMPTDFNNDPSQPDGLSAICIECEEEKEDNTGFDEVIPPSVVAEAKGSLRLNPDARLDPETKFCTKCWKEEPASRS